MKMLKKLGLIAMLVTVLVLTACGGSDEEVLRIGLSLDEANPNAGAANENFIAALEAYIGMPVEVVEDVTYLIGIEAMRSGNLDVMFASSFNYVQAREAVEVEIVATLNPSEDTVTYFIVRGDSDIQTMEDLEGRSFAFVNEASTSGFLFPAYDLINMFDLDATQIAAPGHFFSNVVFSGQHDNSVIGVYNGDFDGAAVIDIIIENLDASGIVERDNLRVVGTSSPHPAPSYIARSEIGEELISQLRSFLLAYDDPEFFEALWVHEPTIRFSEPDAAGYAYVESLARTLGIGE